MIDSLMRAISAFSDGDLDAATRSIRMALDACEQSELEGFDSAMAFYQTARIAAGLNQREAADTGLLKSFEVCERDIGLSAGPTMSLGLALGHHRWASSNPQGCRQILETLAAATVTQDNRGHHARTQHMLAVVLQAANNLPAASKALGRALELANDADDILVREHVDMMLALGAIQLGSGEDPEDTLARAQELAQTCDPPMPELMSRVLRTYAMVLLSKGDVTRAGRLIELAIRTLESTQHASSAMPALLGDRARVRWMVGDPQEAIRQGRRALEAAQQQWTAADPRLILLLSDVAGLLLDESSLRDAPMPPEADELLSRALGIAISIYDEEHALVARLFAQLGRMHLAYDHFDEAMPLLSRAVAVFSTLGANCATERVRAMHDVGLCFVGLGQVDDAAQAFGVILENAEKLGGRGREIATSAAAIIEWARAQD